MANVKRLLLAMTLILVVGLPFLGAQRAKPAEEEDEKGSTETTDEGDMIYRGVVEDVPLSEIIQLYSEFSGRTLMYDPKKISGSVTVAAPLDGVTVSFEDMLYSSLAEFRLCVVSDGTFEKIVPVAEACTMCQTVMPEELESLPPMRFVKVVIHLDRIEANAARTALQNFTSRQGGNVTPVPTSEKKTDAEWEGAGVHAVVVADFAGNIIVLIKTLKAIEQQSAVASRVFKLKHAKGADIQDAVYAAMNGEGYYGYTEDKQSFVLTARPAVLERVAAVIAELDVEQGD